MYLEAQARDRIGDTGGGALPPLSSLPPLVVDPTDKGDASSSGWAPDGTGMADRILNCDDGDGDDDGEEEASGRSDGSRTFSCRGMDA